jgi:predicted DCC family thiol-disulfide oxidoreductase YuxK
MGTPRTFYNANCPVCSAGVAHIRRLTGGDGDLWVDITTRPDALTNYGVDVEAVKKRLHVIDRQGALQVGIPAFAALWDETPRYRLPASIVRLPVVRQGAAALYELLALVLYAWNKRRERLQALACRDTVAGRGSSL